MNNNILIKCLEALNKPDVDISYVRGMLETLIEMNNPTIEQASKAMRAREQPGHPQENVYQPHYTITSTSNTTDEAAILDARAKASLETIKTMSGDSIHE